VKAPFVSLLSRMCQEDIATIIKKIVKKLYQVELGEVLVERPALEEHGDYSTNVALVLAKKLKKLPLAIAEEVRKELLASGRELEVSIAGPGFINFALSNSALVKGLEEILDKGNKYSSLKVGKGKKVNVEFVSANPTGPLHIGNFRGGPLGDTVAAVLQKAGFNVTREYYHNDLGEQVKKLGESILYWKKKADGEECEFPEGGYEGEYVKELAKKLKDKTAKSLGEQAVELFFQKALEISKKAGIRFDVVSKESAIKESGRTEEALKILKKKGFLKEKDNATWFVKKDEFLGDRECVVKKSDHSTTYFSNDLGYHLDKHKRGFEKAIDVWGANHHGHVARMKSGVEALGFGADWLRVPLYQWVTVIRDGKPVSMSKRKGDFVTAEEVLEEVGKDALRWFFLSRAASTCIQFDLDLAKEQSRKNPVYYVQYAHARICAIMRKAGQVPDVKLKIQTLEKEERLLIRELLYLPELVSEIAQSLQVHQLTLYAATVADRFHQFYENCPVLGTPRQDQRIAILKATQIVLANTLALLGISAPDKM